MNSSQIILCLTFALISTVIALLVVRRARHQLWFELVLVVGTVQVAFLGSVLAIAATSDLPALQGLSSITWQETPLIPAVLGALGGAFLVNVPLVFLGGREVEGGDIAKDPDELEEV